LRAAERALASGRHVAGFVAFEAAPAFDRALTTRDPEGPLVCFGVFDGPAPVDPLKTPSTDAGPLAADWTADDPAAYPRAVEAVRAAIAAGDVYQANYTFRLRSLVDPDALEEAYRWLAATHRATYAAYVDGGDWCVLSLSPELLFRLQGRRIETRPMKGTARRGRWTAEDRSARAALAASEKDRAENVMIVDMARNDLSRVAKVGSVRVASLFDVERYPTVFQLTSTVEAELKDDVRLGDVIASLFPAASITGAPKTSAMRLLATLESSPRGVYCGAIGYATPDGTAAFNVAIRTMTVDVATGRAVFGTGGGITWDSVAADEYAEALDKTRCLVGPAAFELLETMRADAGVVVRREQHLARLRDSADRFEFACDPVALESALDAHVDRHSGGPRRVRLRLARDGRTTVDSLPLDSLTPPLPFALATEPVDRDDVLLHHKTSRRGMFERQAAAHPGAWDVLLRNREGELTEFTRGNVVLEIDAGRWTPPRDSGLLGGVFRQHLLDRGEVAERVLGLEDLAGATRVWFINSLREWVRMEPRPLGRW
jgi:para-aminobenzoate synthetase/4-amino-4-deoxychorismate lyase